MTKASLDHDLCFEDQMKEQGYKEKTGYDVACWIEENLASLPGLEYLECHSANPVGRARINQIVEKYFPNNGWTPGP